MILGAAMACDVFLISFSCPSTIREPLRIAVFQCHSRESGNPLWSFHRKKMDSRFRGSDIKIKFYEEIEVPITEKL